MKRLSLFVLLTLFSTSILHAQATPFGQRGAAPAASAAQTARVNGRVLDPSGAVMQLIDVKLVRGTAVEKQTKTDERGQFTMEVPVGDYRFEVTADAFVPISQNIKVVANMPTITVNMRLAALNTTVDAGVKDAVTINEETNLTSTTISGDAIKDLPEDEDQLLAQLQAIAGGSGAAGQQANVVVDGFSGGRLPPRDQIQTIIIDTNVFSAEHMGGPRIQVITKPGTGPWTGGMNFSFNDESMNAKMPWDNNKPSKQLRQIFTNTSGPLIPGKLTFRLGAREFQFDSEGGSIVAITPTGPVNQGISSPLTNRSVETGGQLFISQNNTWNFGLNYGTNKQKNLGVGGFSLPERASDNKGTNYGFNSQTRTIIGTTMIYETRFRIGRNTNAMTPKSTAQAIQVLDSFTGGGAQNHNESKNTSYAFGSTLRWTMSPKLNTIFGMDANYNKRHSLSEANYGGTFVFSSLADYVAGRPITYRQNSGDPVIDVDQWDYAVFAQADYKLTPKVNIGGGLRYQLQTNLEDNNNLGPTAQIAIQASPKTVIRGGARMNFMPFSMGNVEQLMRFDGTNRQFETVILNPSFPNPFATGSGTTSATTGSTLRLRAKDLKSPYQISGAFTLEQTLARNWRVAASTDFSRGVAIIRTRNINAPFPATALSDDLQNRLNSRDAAVQAVARTEVDRMKPFFPTVGNINMYESAGKSFSKNLSLTITPPSNFKLFNVGISGLFRYTLGYIYDDASAQNQYDWRSEWARSSFDLRHRTLTTMSLRLPKAMNLGFFINSSSGRPYTITTGRDNNGDQITADRPTGIGRNTEEGAGRYSVSMNFSRQFSLRKQEPGRQRAGDTMGPNGMPANIQIKQFAEPQVMIAGPGMVIMPPPPPGGPGGPTAGPRMSFNLSANNLLNNTQLNGYSGVMTSKFFRQPTGTGPGRSIQAGLGFNW